MVRAEPVSMRSVAARRAGPTSMRTVAEPQRASGKWCSAWGRTGPLSMRAGV